MSNLRAILPRDLDRRALWAIYATILAASAVVYSHKAAASGSAIVRWYPQVRSWYWEGRNIYDKEMFPNPPIFPITLLPFVALPSPTACAMAWFAFKVALVTGSALLCFRMAREAGQELPGWAQGLVLLLSLRTFLSDLHHGNNNLLILSLVVAALAAWRRGYDVLAGVALGLSIAYKVTPALFLPYFLYKRSYRTVAATLASIFVFLFVVPSLVLGVRFNLACLEMWFHRILSPYVVSDFASQQEINQSMVGVLTRLLTQAPPAVEASRYNQQFDVNFVSWSPKLVVPAIKVLSVGVLALLAVFCRTKTRRRDDARLLGEFSLVVLTMLFVSERSWKHHYVTLLLPYTYLVARFAIGGLSRRERRLVAVSLLASVVLMGTTSDAIGGLFAHHKGHKYALAYGMFFWAGLSLYVATAWRVVVEGRRADAMAAADTFPAPHRRDRRPRLPRPSIPSV
ncbi:MAG TPA: glycosyltransferase family 87 protein [Isosphaeraceae bacterium]|nr:glycosyltransferase family 87 protein [Isosphaeraceae bacterium]